MKKNLNFPRVSIIILNWDGWKDTIECLESLYQITYPNYNVIVVDNASSDKSIEKIKEYCNGKIKVKSPFFKYNPKNKPIQFLKFKKKKDEYGNIIKKEKDISNLVFNNKMILIMNEKNYGFAEGNNIAIKFVIRNLRPDYILLLNNDTVVDKSFLNELVEIMETNEKIGITGPEIRIYNEPNLIQKDNRYKILNAPSKVDWISGCAILIKSKLIKIVGLLDPIYFLWYEDVDYCTRANKFGYKVMYIPTKGKVFHKISASLKKKPKTIPYYKTRNHFIFRKKYLMRKEFLNFLLNYVTKVFVAQLKKFSKSGNIYPFLKGVLAGLIVSLRIKRI